MAAVITASLLLLYILLCYEDFHFHVAHVYARLGYPNAQHILGQRYLQGNVSPIRGQLAARVCMLVSQNHKRGFVVPPHCCILDTVFYNLSVTLLPCLTPRSWSRKRWGHGHALVQVRNKKKPQAIPAMGNWLLLGKGYCGMGGGKRWQCLGGEAALSCPVLLGTRFTGGSRDSRSSWLLTVDCIMLCSTFSTCYCYVF